MSTWARRRSETGRECWLSRGFAAGGNPLGLRDGTSLAVPDGTSLGCGERQDGCEESEQLEELDGAAVGCPLGRLLGNVVGCELG